ncbi:unnamed protein product [Amoebophrya sp. A25]|nr:unnamed protein product [Amoebophrya sp. A25]|eukprot:GSA25T00022007001.1
MKEAALPNFYFAVASPERADAILEKGYWLDGLRADIPVATSPEEAHAALLRRTQRAQTGNYTGRNELITSTLSSSSSSRSRCMIISGLEVGKGEYDCSSLVDLEQEVVGKNEQEVATSKTLLQMKKKYEEREGTQRERTPRSSTLKSSMTSSSPALANGPSSSKDFRILKINVGKAHEAGWIPVLRKSTHKCRHREVGAIHREWHFDTDKTRSKRQLDFMPPEAFSLWAAE